MEIDAEAGAPITARADELEQAIVNLLDNALRAVRDKGKIRITVSVDGDARLVAVEDDGPGMAEDVRARALEPFFTTRPAGEGSGLGLAITQRIAEHHRGSLTITSALGKGTRVELRVRDASEGVGSNAGAG